MEGSSPLRNLSTTVKCQKYPFSTSIVCMLNVPSINTRTRNKFPVMITSTLLRTKTFLFYSQIKLFLTKDRRLVSYTERDCSTWKPWQHFTCLPKTLPADFVQIKLERDDGRRSIRSKYKQPSRLRTACLQHHRGSHLKHAQCWPHRLFIISNLLASDASDIKRYEDMRTGPGCQ